MKLKKERIQDWESETIQTFQRFSNLIVFKASTIAKNSVVKEKADNGTLLANLRGHGADSL